MKQLRNDKECYITVKDIYKTEIFKKESIKSLLWSVWLVNKIRFLLKPKISVNSNRSCYTKRETDK